MTHALGENINIKEDNMFTNRLKSGEKAYLHKWGDNSSKGIITRIEHYRADDKELHIWPPKVNGRTARLSSDSFYEIRLFGETAEYRYKVKFIAHDEVDGFPISRFKLLHDGEKILRRDAFRLNLDTMVLFSVVQEDGHQSEKLEGRVIDLSSGGVRILTNQELNRGELLNLSIQLDNDLIIAFGDIRFSAAAPPPSRRGVGKNPQPRYTHQYGVSFVMLGDSDEEKIIQYMYRKQREALINARKKRP